MTFPGWAIPMQEIVVQGGWKDMVMGYGSLQKQETSGDQSQVTNQDKTATVELIPALFLLKTGIRCGDLNPVCSPRAEQGWRSYLSRKDQLTNSGP